MDSAQIISRGEHAQRLLSDPLMQEVLTHLQNSVRDAFFDLPADAVEAREKLHLMDCARRQFVSVFHALMDGAEMAKHELLMEENARVKAQSIMERVRNV